MSTKKIAISEDWLIVITGAFILILSLLFPHYMPSMPKTLDNWGDAGMAVYLLAFLYIVILLDFLILRRATRGLLLSLTIIYCISLASQLISNIPFIKEIGLEPVFFSVVFGLLVSNLLKVPDWMKPAIQSEFYIKTGIVCLGATILIGDVMKSGAYGLLQALVVVFAVWFMAFRVSRRMGVDGETSTMLASSVSICGVSAAIATAGVINGDNKKLSYIVSLVLVCAVPMMYLMPWLANMMGLSPDVAGAWLGGTIDTTGAVAASGTMLGEEAANTAIIVKSSQNVLLGVAAFVISIFWSFQSEGTKKAAQKPTAKLIWQRFPKFVVGFVLASLVFSLLIDGQAAREAGKIAKDFTNSLFSIAFVCVGLETRFRDIVSKENRNTLKAFLAAQGFNIVFTLLVAWLIFDVIKG